MNKRLFTDEEIEMLRKNPNTDSVTAKTIRFTKEFREEFYERITKGERGKTILTEAGYPVDVLGTERVKSMAYKLRLKHGYNAKTVRKTSNEKDQEKLVKQLLQRIDYLEQEVDFLKKISAVRKTKE